MLEFTHDAKTRDDGPGFDRRATRVKIEQFLDAGRDHYSEGQYQRAIDVWSRVLLLDRSHVDARVRIERARSALAERLRQSEELVHTGLEAFKRGDVGRARSLLTSAVEQGGSRDEALSALERLDRLEGIGLRGCRDDGVRSRRSKRAGEPAGGAARRSALPLACLSLLAGGIVCFAVVQGAWDLAFGRRHLPPQPVSVARSVEPLPLPSETDMGMARARRLVASGRWRAALKVLDGMAQGKVAVAESETLRATITRQLGGAGDVESGRGGIAGAMR